jgi:predicted nucleotidyltransferase
MKHAYAVKLAGEFVNWLRDCCIRIELVGSVKRGDKDEVHDIEILLIADATAPGLQFGRKIIYKTKLEKLLAQLVREGILREARNKANGDKLKRFAIVEFSEDEDFCLELFIVRPETWGIQNVIRTGPLEFSKWFVTNKAKRGLLPDNLQYIKGETQIIDPGNRQSAFSSGGGRRPGGVGSWLDRA